METRDSHLPSIKMNKQIGWAFCLVILFSLHPTIHKDQGLPAREKFTERVIVMTIHISGSKVLMVKQQRQTEVVH